MPHPRLHHRLTGCLAVTTLLALGSGLAGCTPDGDAPDDPTPTTAETASELPFDSEDEALEEARETYRNYLRVADEIMHDGGKRPSQIDEFAVDEAREAVHQGASYLSKNNKTYEGWSQFDELSITHFDTGPTEELSARVCTDVSDVEIYDSSGSSTVAEDRAPKVVFTLDFKVDTDGKLVLAHREVVANSCD